MVAGLWHKRICREASGPGERVSLVTRFCVTAGDLNCGSPAAVKRPPVCFMGGADIFSRAAVTE